MAIAMAPSMPIEQNDLPLSSERRAAACAALELTADVDMAHCCGRVVRRTSLGRQMGFRIEEDEEPGVATRHGYILRTEAGLTLAHALVQPARTRAESGRGRRTAEAAARR